MPNLRDDKPGERLFVLHIGNSGSGKSCAAATYPGPIYWFDIDGRIRGIKGHPIARQRVEAGLIEYDRYPMTKQGVEMMDKKLAEFKKLSWKLPYKTIVFDTITSFDRMALAYANEYIKDPAKKFGKVYTESFDHYNVEKKLLEEVLTVDLKELPCNVIVGAHWSTSYEAAKPGLPATIPTGKKVALRDKLAEVVPTWFDDIFYFNAAVERVEVEDERGKRMQDDLVYTATFRNELARTTFVELPNALDWTNQDFYKLLTDSMLEENREALQKLEVELDHAQLAKFKVKG